VRPDRRQRYPRVAVNHFEVERLAPGGIFTVKERAGPFRIAMLYA
jgi:hypothetical protein